MVHRYERCSGPKCISVVCLEIDEKEAVVKTVKIVKSGRKGASELDGKDFVNTQELSRTVVHKEDPALSEEEKDNDKVGVLTESDILNEKK